MNNSSVTSILVILVIAAFGVNIYIAVKNGSTLGGLTKMFDSGKKKKKKKIKVIAFNMRRDFRDKQLGVVELQFENSGKTNQPYPVLRVSLKDSLGLKIQESRIPPGKYLDKSIPIHKGMEPNQIVSYTFRFKIPADSVPSGKMPTVHLAFE
jgi:hypothetical protein